MKVLIFNLIFFPLALFIQLAIWKIKTPKNQVATLSLIFFSVFILGMIFCSHLFALQSLPEYLQAIFAYASLFLAYLITFSAIEVDSPSMLIINIINMAKERGVTREQLISAMSNDRLLKPRLIELNKARLIYKDKQKYKISFLGSAFIRLFIFYRNMIGAGRGG